jgi:hypothetical protein
MTPDEVNQKVSEAADILQPLETPWIIIALMPDGSGRVVDGNTSRWQEFSTNSRDARQDLQQLLDVTVWERLPPEV